MKSEKKTSSYSRASKSSAVSTSQESEIPFPKQIPALLPGKHFTVTLGAFNNTFKWPTNGEKNQLVPIVNCPQANPKLVHI